MSDDKFRLPQSSYEELVKVIKAYGHFPDPATLEDISQLIGLHTTIISRNAGFLIGLGILETGAKKILTANGKRLSQALEHNMVDESRTWWREIVSGNDFLTRLLSAIKIRNGMDQQTLEAHIAYSAGQPKKPQFMTGARTVIDILLSAELIKEVDGKYVANQNQSAMSESTSAREILSAPTADKRPVGTLVSSTIPTVPSGLVIKIQININCTPTEVPNLGQHIKKLIDEISSPTPNAESEAERSE
jgi:hypothetical protein